MIRTLQTIRVPYGGEFHYNGPGPMEVLGVVAEGREPALVVAVPGQYGDGVEDVWHRFITAAAGQVLPENAKVLGFTQVDRSLLGLGSGLPVQLTTVAVLEIPA